MKSIDSFLGKKFFEAVSSVDGKSADKNGSKGLYGVNEPTDDAAAKGTGISKEQISKNMKNLLFRFKTKKDFFILGRAGWGKTSIINDIAKRLHYEVITVYLDKADAKDLGGLPIPDKDEKGNAVQKTAIPSFAEPIFAHPEKKFLLFFDEMNQAAPDVMNALMPIVLEHEIAGRKPTDKDGKPVNNFFCGAAGNFEDENDAVFELSKPLASRFKPIIIWETHTDESWAAAFRHLHNKWDNKVGKDLVDKVEEAHEVFDNPREIEQKLLDALYKMKNGNEDEIKDLDDDTKELLDSKNWDTEDYLMYIQGLLREEPELNRTEEAQVQKLAEACYDYVNKDGSAEDDEDDRGKDRDMIPTEIKDAIKQGMKHGFLSDTDEKTGKKRKYGISKENIFKIEDIDINAEQLTRLIRKLEAEGVEWKYKTDQEWKDAGYEDPNAD